MKSRQDCLCQIFRSLCAAADVSLGMQSNKHLMKFGGTTSMHGAQKVILSQSPLRRRIWLVIFLSAWVMFIFQVALVCGRYFAFPKKVTVHIDADGVPFPSITLCKMRSLDFHLVHRLQTIYRENESLSDALKKHGSSHEFIEKFLNFYHPIQKMYTHVRNNLDQYELIDKSNVKELHRELVSSRTMAANIDREIISEASTKLKQFIVSCQYERKDCDMLRDFNESFQQQFFNCFTYKSPQIDAQRESGTYPAMKEGIQDGWSAVLFAAHGMLGDMDPSPRFRIAGISDKASASGGSEGVRVIIHPPDTVPFAQTEGYDVPPGFSVTFTIEPQINRRIGYPYGQCTLTNPFDTSSTGSYYRSRSCTGMCLQQHVLDSCGCVDSDLPMLNEYCNTSHVDNKDSTNTAYRCYQIKNSSSGSGNFIQFCRHIDCLTMECKIGKNSPLNSFFKRIKCSEEVKTDFYQNKAKMAACGCQRPCDEYSYAVSYSLSKWPPSNVEGQEMWVEIFGVDKFARRFSNNKSTDAFEMYDNYSKTYSAKAVRDFSRINVFVDDSSVVNTEETPDYLLFQLISDIGGQLGIWIGVSVITVSEAFEMAFFIARDAVSGLWRREKAKEAKEDDNDHVGVPLSNDDVIDVHKSELCDGVNGT